MHVIAITKVTAFMSVTAITKVTVFMSVTVITKVIVFTTIDFKKFLMHVTIGGKADLKNSPFLLDKELMRCVCRNILSL